MEGRHALIVERHLAAYEDVENDTKTPYIYLGASIYFGVKKFGCSKIQRTAEGGEVGMGREEVGQAEVDYLDVSASRDQDVFDFQVLCRVNVS